MTLLTAKHKIKISELNYENYDGALYTENGDYVTQVRRFYTPYETYELMLSDNTSRYVASDHVLYA